jgi:hypothetical protein
LCQSSNASDLAYLKKYSISPLPNYALSAPPSDIASLTDGKFTVGYFWAQKTTLGWQNVRTVEILIDLGKESNIDSIVFSTARGEQAGVNYPALIAAFVGSSKDQLYYVGDIAKDPGNVIGPYQTKKFTLNGIAARGRYVLLEVRPNGPYLFCDEIEVLEGDRGGTVKARTLTLEDARIFAEKLRRLDLEKEFLTDLIAKVKSSIVIGTNNTQLLAGIQQRIDNLAAITDAEAIEADILKLRATLLSNQFPGKHFLLETSNPWAPLSPTATPGDHPLQSIAMAIPQGGYDHAAFVVTNLTADTQQISIRPGVLPQQAPALAFYHVPFVKSAAIEYVADPLVPIVGSFELRAGESKMVFLAAHGVHPGKWQGTLKVAVGADVNSIPLTLQVSKVALPAKLSLNSNNWGYLDFKPIRARKADAVKDLFAHHTNVVVVPAWHIPFTDPAALRDLIRMEEYLSLSKGASKVLYFFNFNEESLLTVNGKYQFMSDEWKKWFKEFYSRLVKSAARAGFTEDQMYLYPFDEMRGKDIDRFVTFASWARKEIPKIKFFATLERKEALKALPYLDIAQVINRDDMYADAIASKKEIWIYDATENTKSLSPYSYYRLMSWKAFYHGFKGVGFWNYADTGSGENPGSAWDDFDGKRPDFAVVYEGVNGTIVSSRRWEAWRMGIEDYELLTIYAKAKGQKAAHELARTVLDSPQNTGKADSVRQQILMELAH